MMPPGPLYGGAGEGTYPDPSQTSFLGAYGPSNPPPLYVFDNTGKIPYIIYGGRIYYWDGGRWLDINGIGGHVPISFAMDPFANAEPAEWGKPFPIWANGVRGGANPMAMAYHIQQQQLIQVLAYVEMNTDLEIPLIDANGNSLLDPAIPPCSKMRWNSNSTTDRVGDVANTANDWTDVQTGVRGYLSNNDTVADNELETRCFSHIFRIEKTPNPHWVLRISYSWNKLTTAGGGSPLTTDPRTVLVSCIGNSSSQAAVQTILSGSAGVAGHYAITRVFWGDQAPNSVAADHTRFKQPILTHDYAFVAPAAVVSQVIFTDTGGAGGTSLYHGSYAPYIRPYGDMYWGVDHATTEQNWNASSMGVGTYSDGIWQGHPDASGNPQSIQHPEFDQYITQSILQYAAGGYWYLDIYAYCGTNDAAGNPIEIGTGYTDSRHMPVFGFGRVP